MIIGIGGVSNAGKTTLAGILQEELRDISVKIIHQDDFINAVENIPRVRDRIDWEDPLSIDFKRFQQAISDASNKYQIVIAEGFLVFYQQELNKLYDKKIFLEIPKKLFIERKILDNRWGFEPVWYLEHIWQTYLKCGTIKVTDADMLMLRGDRDYPVGQIIHFLETWKYVYVLQGASMNE